MGVFAGMLIGKFVDKVFDRLEADLSAPVQKKDADDVKPIIEKVAREEIAPVIEHLTNNEPFYRSRVWWGSVGSILGGAATIITMAANGVPLSLETYGPPVGAIWGGATALWGRYAARKPIGA